MKSDVDVGWEVCILDAQCLDLVVRCSSCVPKANTSESIIIVSVNTHQTMTEIHLILGFLVPTGTEWIFPV